MENKAKPYIYRNIDMEKYFLLNQELHKYQDQKIEAMHRKRQAHHDILQAAQKETYINDQLRILLGNKPLNKKHRL